MALATMLLFSPDSIDQTLVEFQFYVETLDFAKRFATAIIEDLYNDIPVPSVPTDAFLTPAE